ncbi:MAG: hypothetical protein H6827_09745 [Planctomycetes bacterium]|nr:hypothetical protein [Planctomycetota bacterium]
MKPTTLKFVLGIEVALFLGTLVALHWSTSLPSPEPFAFLAMALIPQAVAMGIVAGKIEPRP